MVLKCKIREFFCFSCSYTGKYNATCFATFIPLFWYEFPNLFLWVIFE